ncbi:MAG TPA: hypothetical protein VG411_05445 [Actinomycetota bacterium]|nr:hypothetical protein [Actinomycetota bacterium]
MTETVVVAIITAVATLTASILASAVTSWLTLRGVSQQSEQQLRLAREARADQRAAEHRRSRREAYVRFLTESLEATALVRTARAPGIPEGTFEVRYAAAEAALDGLIPAHGLVLLEGPDALADAVQEVRDSLRMELDLVRAVRQGSKTDEQLRAARSARATAAGAMAEKARKALGGDIDTA